jgi:hypothetical protein
MVVKSSSRRGILEREKVLLGLLWMPVVNLFGGVVGAVGGAASTLWSLS